MQVNDKQKQISKLLWDFQSLREEHVLKICNCTENDINCLIANKVLTKDKNTKILNYNNKREVNNRNIVAFDVVMEYLDRNPKLNKAKYPINVSMKTDEFTYDIIAIKEEETENYYITRNNNKEYIELNSVPLIAKVDMNANTVITTDLITKSDNPTTDDLRQQEYNMLVLPTDLQTGDYIDIRVQFPSGQDFIVVSKKEVEIPQIGGTDSPDTIWVDLTEDEILHMSCAIVESYRVSGAKLYVTKYTEAGMQAASTPTFPVNRETSELISNNPNIVERIKQEINARYNNNGSVQIRNEYINPTINSTGEEGNTNLQTKMDESIKNSQNSRKEYLDSLAGELSTTEE